MSTRTKLSSKAEKLRDDVPRRVQNNDDKTMGWLYERGVLGKRIASLIGPRLSTSCVLRFGRLTTKILVKLAKLNTQRILLLIFYGKVELI